MILRRISHQQLVGFYHRFYAENKQGHRRLGQTFLEDFFYPQLNDSLYYEENDGIAREMIESHYVELEKVA
jgi:hypothetical protein